MTKRSRDVAGHKVKHKSAKSFRPAAPTSKVDKILVAQAVSKAPEKKYLDTNVNVACNTTGSVSCLNLIAEGAENNQRTGRLIHIKSLEVKGIFYPAATSDTIIEQWGQVKLYWDRDPNGSTPPASTFFQAGTIGPIQFSNIDNEDRMVCLGEVNAIQDGTASASGTYGLITCEEKSNGSAFFHRFIKINETARFNGSSAAVPTSGAIWAVVCGDVASAATNLQIGMQCRIRYTDQ